MTEGTHSAILLIIVMSSLTLGKPLTKALTTSRRNSDPNFKENKLHRSPVRTSLSQRLPYREPTDSPPLFRNKDQDFVTAPHHHWQFPQLTEGTDSDIGAVSKIIYDMVVESFHDGHKPESDSTAVTNQKRRVPINKINIAPHNIEIRVTEVEASVRDIPINEYELNAPSTSKIEQPKTITDINQNIKGINQKQENRKMPYPGIVGSGHKRLQHIKNEKGKTMPKHNRFGQVRRTGAPSKGEFVEYNRPLNKDAKERLPYKPIDQNTPNIDQHHGRQNYPSTSSDKRPGQESDKIHQREDLFNGDNLAYPDNDVPKSSRGNKKQLSQRFHPNQFQLNEKPLDYPGLNSILDTSYTDSNNNGDSQMDQRTVDSYQLDPNILHTFRSTNNFNTDHNNYAGYPGLHSAHLNRSYLNSSKRRGSKLYPNNLIFSPLYSHNLKESQPNPNNFDYSNLYINNLRHSQLDADNLDNSNLNLNRYQNPYNLDEFYSEKKTPENPYNLDEFYSEKNTPEKSYSENSQMGKHEIDHAQLGQNNLDNSNLNSYEGLDHSYHNPNNVDYSQLETHNLDDSRFEQDVEDKFRTKPNFLHPDQDRKKHRPGQDHQHQTLARFSTNEGVSNYLAKPKCQMEFYFDFLNNWKERSGKIWMGHSGNMKAVDGRAQFSGTPQSYLSIPFFSGNDLRPHYRLSLVLESNGAPGLPMTVVSNARFRPATFGIYVVKRSVYVALVPRLDTQNSYLSAPVFVGLPIDTIGPNHVVVDHDDKTRDLWLTVNGKSVHVVARTPMVSSEPLYIGSGSSPFQATQPLRGAISALSFHKCPRKFSIK